MKKRIEELRDYYGRSAHKQVIKQVFFGGRWIKYYGLKRIK